VLNYQKDGEVAVIHIDDGKANAINHTFIEELTEALERSRNEASAIALFGRPGRFSGGFDLSVVGDGGTAAQTLVAAGEEVFELDVGEFIEADGGGDGLAVAG